MDYLGEHETNNNQFRSQLLMFMSEMVKTKDEK